MLYAGFMSAAPPSAPTPPEPVESPQLVQLGFDADEPCLRADAARNRARLLEAAAGLVAAHGADAVTMEEVAAAAGVGKGTVFRRFGDRTGLLMALLDHGEKKLQAAFLGGPRRWAPARPAERLRAFGRAALHRTVEDLELQLAAQPDPGRRFTVPPYRVRTTTTSPCCCARRPRTPTASCSPTRCWPSSTPPWSTT